MNNKLLCQVITSHRPVYNVCNPIGYLSLVLSNQHSKVIDWLQKIDITIKEPHILFDTNIQRTAKESTQFESNNLIHFYFLFFYNLLKIEENQLLHPSQQSGKAIMIYYFW